jgi:hypothetical protein
MDYLCTAQPILEKIPIIGDFVGIPLQFAAMYRNKKTEQFNSAIADKISNSCLKNELKISILLSEVIEHLIECKEF